MKILVIYRHFWPDTPPYASMLRSITADLAAAGHEVEVWAEMPCYKLSAADNTLPRDQLLTTGKGRVRVRRMGWLPGWRRFGVMRTAAKALFPLRVLLWALAARGAGRRFDLVWTATMPPVINGVAGGWIARLLGARFVYHFQDIWPELGGVSGIWPKGGVIYRALAALEGKTCAKMDGAVVLSEDMAQSLIARGVPREKISIINNFMLEDFSATGQDQPRPTSAPTPPEGDGRFRVIFAGNIGRFQGLEAVVDAARHLGDLEDLDIVFMGEGAALKALKARAADLPHVQFEGHRPFEAAQGVIAGADLGLVSIEPEIYRYAYPSKTLTYLGLGVPVLAVVEPASALAGLIEAEDIGTVAQGRSPEAIAAAIRAAYDRRADLPAMRARALAHYEAHMSRPAALARWRAMVASHEETR